MSDVKMLPDEPGTPEAEILQAAESLTSDLGRHLLNQAHDAFDDFHKRMANIHYREQTKDLGAAPPLFSFTTCEKWQELRPAVLKIAAFVQTISVMFPVFAKVTLVLNTLIGLLDTICPLAQATPTTYPYETVAETPVQEVTEPTETPDLGKPLTY